MSTRTLLILVQVCFGVFPVLGKLAMPPFAPRAVLVWRLFVGAGVLSLAAVLRHGRAAWPGARELPLLAGLSLLGVTINQALFLEGLARSSAVNAGLLMTVIPVATTALAVLFGQEVLTRRRQIGIALAVAGVLWFFLGRGAGLQASTATGDLLMAINALSYSFYLVLSKPLLARLPQLVVVAWIFLFGALLAPWLSLDVDWMPSAAGPAPWAALAGILLFPTLFAYLGNAVVLSRARASTTAAYVMLQPFIAALLGIALLGERPDAAVGVAGAAVLSGLWLVSSGPAESWPEDRPAGRTALR